MFFRLADGCVFMLCFGPVKFPAVAFDLPRFVPRCTALGPEPPAMKGGGCIPEVTLFIFCLFFLRAGEDLDGMA
jgi:hypothetical protein